MTIVAACIKEGKAFIGCDSLITNNNARDGHRRKIVKFPGFVVGTAGMPMMIDIVEEMARDEDLHFPMKTLEDAKKFARVFWDNLRSDLAINGNESELNSSQLLIVTPEVIWDIDPYFNVLVHEDYSAIGCGEVYAITTFRVASGFVNDPQELVRLAVDSACYFDRGCSLPMYLWQVGEEEARRRKKMTETKKAAAKKPKKPSPPAKPKPTKKRKR
jgi:ATP-dependent protease HslVU (ClpYQ) peptidase subunit